VAGRLFQPVDCSESAAVAQSADEPHFRQRRKLSLRLRKGRCARTGGRNKLQRRLSRQLQLHRSARVRRRDNRPLFARRGHFYARPPRTAQRLRPQTFEGVLCDAGQLQQSQHRLQRGFGVRLQPIGRGHILLGALSFVAHYRDSAVTDAGQNRLRRVRRAVPQQRLHERALFRCGDPVQSRDRTVAEPLQRSRVSHDCGFLCGYFLHGLSVGQCPLQTGLSQLPHGRCPVGCHGGALHRNVLPQHEKHHIDLGAHNRSLTSLFACRSSFPLYWNQSGNTRL
jgi:hypothetical protein